MKKTVYTLICMLIFISTSCERTIDNFTFQIKPYNGNELRLDGYYYNTHKHATDTGIGVGFLYKNGVASGFNTCNDNNDFHYLDSMIQDSSWYFDRMNDIISWGIFAVDSNKIKIEMWWYGGIRSYITRTLSGTIQNDTTFTISEIDKSKLETPWTYHFRYFPSKPDSLNNFVKFDYIPNYPDIYEQRRTKHRTIECVPKLLD